MHRPIGRGRIGRSADPLRWTRFYAVAVNTRGLRALRAEPRAPGAPARVDRDWWLLGILLAGVAVEAVVHTDLAWRPASLVVGAALPFTVLWRRTHPLEMLAIAFGVIHAFGVAIAVFEDQRYELYSLAFVLILVYSLFRWASGREMTIGAVIVLGALLLGLITDSENVSDVVGGIIVMSLPVALGVSIRLRSTVRVQRLDQAKMHEREQLARELHDTVAHHVSGIAIQAQAGRFLASTGSLDGAASALAVIEEEASRALAEMRSMIGLLRDGDRSPEMMPQRGVADIERLATGARLERPQIDVVLDGDLGNLRPAVDAAVYRMAQESITNAVRHARHATGVEVRVCGDADAVRLTVCDDGDASQVGSRGAGFGLVGMTERAMLLGGTLDAGPGPNGGWTVRAVIPRSGSVS
jgi:signal transduction histidine kinase